MSGFVDLPALLFVELFKLEKDGCFFCWWTPSFKSFHRCRIRDFLVSSHQLHASLGFMHCPSGIWISGQFFRHFCRLHEVFLQNLPALYLSPSILPLIMTSSPIPADEKHPHNIILPPPCFTAAVVLFWWWSIYRFDARSSRYLHTALQVDLSEKWLSSWHLYIQARCVQ